MQVDRALLKAKVDAMEEQIAASGRGRTAAGRTSSGAAWLSENERRPRPARRAGRGREPRREVALDEDCRHADGPGDDREPGGQGKQVPRLFAETDRTAPRRGHLVQLTAGGEAAIKEAELTVFARRKEAEANDVFRRHDELEQLKCQLRGFQIAEDNLRNQYASLQKEMEKASGDSMELLFKRDELNQSQKVLDRIAERQSQLQTEQGVAARVIWHEEAIPRRRPCRISPIATPCWPC